MQTLDGRHFDVDDGLVVRDLAKEDFKARLRASDHGWEYHHTDGGSYRRRVTLGDDAEWEELPFEAEHLM